MSPGKKVKVTKLESTKEMIVSPQHLSRRERGITGVILNAVPGHGGDVWFVRHDNSEDIGVYYYTELKEVKL